MLAFFARRLGLDSVEVRRRNIVTPHVMPHRMPSGYRIDSGDFGVLLGEVLDLAGPGPADPFEGTRIALEVTPEGGGHASGPLVELPPAVRAKPKLWTPERIAKWRRTGEVPYPVMVWAGDLTGQFLDFTGNHRLYALFHPIAHTGLRRGEGCG